MIKLTRLNDGSSIYVNCDAIRYVAPYGDIPEETVGCMIHFSGFALTVMEPTATVNDLVEDQRKPFVPYKATDVDKAELQRLMKDFKGNPVILPPDTGCLTIRPEQAMKMWELLGKANRAPGDENTLGGEWHEQYRKLAAELERVQFCVDSESDADYFKHETP